MSLKIHYCPNCFTEIPPGTEYCPHCGTRLADWKNTLNYQERLIHALGHPLSDVRMRAIISLGNRGEESAITPLLACAFRHPSDVVEGLEIVNALRKLPGDPRHRALEQLAATHPAHAVRERAQAMLNDASNMHKGDQHAHPPLGSGRG